MLEREAREKWDSAPDGWHQLDGEVKLEFFDCNPLFMSWGKHPIQYSIEARTQSFFSPGLLVPVDFSGHPYWKKMIGHQIQEEYIDEENQVLRISDGENFVFLSSRYDDGKFQGDCVRVSIQNPLQHYAAADVSIHPMDSMRIYADFNGLQRSNQDLTKSMVPLDTYGSLCDLAFAKIILTEGASFTIYDESDEEEDLEANAVARFDPGLGCWVAEIDDQEIRDVPTKGQKVSPLVCVSCRGELAAFVAEEGLNGKTLCPNCGTPVWLPIHPPSGMVP